MKDPRKITKGVGQFTDHPDRPRQYFRLEEALIFLETHCTHPELYQDVKNLVSDIRINNTNGYPGYTLPPKSLLLRFGLFPIHSVLRVKVGQQRARYTAYFGPNPIRDFYFSVSDDGLITDILPERPNMNPTTEFAIQHIGLPAAYEVQHPCGMTT